MATIEGIDETSNLLPKKDRPPPLPSSSSSSSDSRPVDDGERPPNDQITQPPFETDVTIIWTVVPVALLGVFVAHADTSLVIATSHSVASEFNALSSASWLFTSYGLAQCAAQPLFGKLSIIFGRKNNLVFCYVLFAIGCFLCAVAREYWQIIAGRVISGVGGAGMTALVSIIIADLVPVRQIAAWRSFVNVAATTGRSIGGPVGGLLTDTVGWRWSFLGQVPLTILGLLLISWKLPSTLPQSKKPHNDTTTLQKLKRIDFSGAVALTITISFFLLSLDFATKYSSWYKTVIAAAIAAIAGVAFYLVERYRAREPILPIELIVQRVTLTSYLIIGFQIAAQTSDFYATPIYFQISASSSVADAGSHMIPAVIGNALGGILSGVIVSKTARYKYLTIFASTIATIGYILILLRWKGSTNWFEAQYIFLGGFGMGIAQSTTFIHLAASLTQDDLAIAGATWYLAQNVFGLVGVQTSTAVFHAALLEILDRNLKRIKHGEKFYKQAIGNISSIKSMPENVRSIVIRSYVDSLRYAFGIPIIFATFGLLLGISTREGRIV